LNWLSILITSAYPIGKSVLVAKTLKRSFGLQPSPIYRHNHYLKVREKISPIFVSQQVNSAWHYRNNDAIFNLCHRTGERDCRLYDMNVRLASKVANLMVSAINSTKLACPIRCFMSQRGGKLYSREV
jgi:hypothetical protein